MRTAVTDQELDEAIATLSQLSGHATNYAPATAEPVDDTVEFKMVDPQNGQARDAEGAKSKAFHLNLLKLSSRKTTKEGQPAKKRGPKPDSRPAATRRQELNRQAQRSHRERKEVYTRNMETEVCQLRIMVVEQAEERKIIVNENERLKALLGAKGISYDHIEQASSASREQLPPRTNGVSVDFNSHPTSTAADSAHRSPTNASGSQGTMSPVNQTAPSSRGFTSRSASHEASASRSPTASLGTTLSTRASPVSHGAVGQAQVPILSPGETAWNPINQPGSVSFLGVGGTPMPSDANVPQPQVLDLDQIGIDFVLALEANCHDHISFMAARAYNDNEEELGGHALMLTCPPADHLLDNPGEQYPHKMPNGPKETLAGLINMSHNLPLQGGELTPVVAWQVIREDERFQHLHETDFHNLTTSLKEKCRCYGFGAVVEMYEVYDTLDSLFKQKELALREFLKQAQQSAHSPDTVYHSPTNGREGNNGMDTYSSPVGTAEPYDGRGGQLYPSQGPIHESVVQRPQYCAPNHFVGAPQLSPVRANGYRQI